MPSFRPSAELLKRSGWVAAGAVLVALVLSVQLWLTSFFSWEDALLRTMLDTLPWLVALPVLVPLMLRFPPFGRQRTRHALLHLTLGLACSCLLPVSSAALSASFGWTGGPPPRRTESPGPRPDGAHREPPPRPPVWRMALGRAPLHWGIYALLLTLVSGWSFSRRVDEQEKKAVMLQQLLAEARLSSLTWQLQPHFLFNTLNTIAAVTREKPAAAETLLLDLSDLLRRTLRASDRPSVPLHEELTLLELYLALQRARFGERLAVTKQIATEVLLAEVPVLLLQPLVENAVRHGLDATFGTVRIHLRAELSGGEVHLTVANEHSGACAPAGGGGIGLQNTRARLAALYGPAASFRAEPQGENGFLVECRLPFRPLPPTS